MENSSAATSKAHRDPKTGKVLSLIVKGIYLAFINVQNELVWKATTSSRVVNRWKVVSGLKNLRYFDFFLKFEDFRIYFAKSQPYDQQ